LPSLEFAATAVAVVLSLRALRLSGTALDQRRSRVESGRARDLIGLAILVGAVAYALGAARASTWFLVASGVAIAAQLAGFYLRARQSPEQARLSDAGRPSGPEVEVEDEELYACPQCGHGTLIEIDEPQLLLGGLNQLSPVAAVVCPGCGALSGQVDEPAKIPIGPEHGTSLRHSPMTEDHEALEEPREHEG
ncbi:MAG TPA: hypothetical protein VEQ59_05070, partial [Polyangiaceae bacterium]|nr:hypothetical protein [Polyangiaceae bacterium]